MAGEVRPRPSPAPSHSTPSLTALVCHRPAQRTTEIPANSRHHGPRAVPSVSSVLSLPPGPIADRHRRPQERLQAARRSPAYPNTSPDNRACNSLTPFRCPHAVHLYESVDSGLGARLACPLRLVRFRGTPHDYSANGNLNVKVLDFVQLGGHSMPCTFNQHAPTMIQPRFTGRSWRRGYADSRHSSYRAGHSPLAPAMSLLRESQNAAVTVMTLYAAVTRNACV